MKIFLETFEISVNSMVLFSVLFFLGTFEISVNSMLLVRFFVCRQISAPRSAYLLMESYQETFEGGHLSIVGQGLTEIPAGLAAKYGDSVTELDLTDNNIRHVHLSFFLPL